jgi:hypothetical protein
VRSQRGAVHAPYRLSYGMLTALCWLWPKPFLAIGSKTEIALLRR